MHAGDLGTGPALARAGKRRNADDTHGRVRIGRADGSGARDVVPTPGYYAEPSFSPDGRFIVYRAVRADGTRGITHGEDPGICIAPVAGGEPSLVREGGDDPQFDHTGDRVYFRECRDNRFILASVTRAGGDEAFTSGPRTRRQSCPHPMGGG
jgi:WD40-like Beta Propeller Repeat